MYCTQAWGAPFLGSPPLDPANYTRCFAMTLDGFVDVQATTNIKFDSMANNTSFANQFRICARFSGNAAVTLNGNSLERPRLLLHADIYCSCM